MLAEILLKSDKSPAKKWPTKLCNYLLVRRISAGHFFLYGGMRATWARGVASIEERGGREEGGRKEGG